MQVISHSTGINIEEFPMLEGEQDDSPRFKRAIEYCIQNELTEIRLPNRTYYVLQSINTKGIKLVGVGNRLYRSWIGSIRDLGVMKTSTWNIEIVVKVVLLLQMQISLYSVVA